MPIRDSSPLMWVASGLTDSPNEFSAFPGACTSLANFIFSRSNRNAITCRPGVGIDISSGFTGFTTPATVTCSMSLGTRIYGMLASGLNAGKDQPFCFDTATSAFVAISGITSGNSPTTQSTTGAWTPPTMAVVSTKILITHPGFSTNVVGVIDISSPGTPAWSSYDLTTNAFPAKPTWVAQFFNRAYYGCGNVVVYSDVLVPLTRTNASQSITCGDTNPTVFGVGLPVSTGTQGILQGLVIFKGAGNGIWQVTGDPSIYTLALNQLSDSSGTNAPWSVAATPTGIAYMDNDGLRLVNFSGQIGFLNSDIVEPFINATTPSRAVASYTNSVYRICLDTIINGIALIGADYWYDFLYQRWNGPHTFAYNTCVEITNNFYLTSNTLPAAIFKSSPTPASSSIYTDNGAIANSTVTSAVLNMESSMDMKSIIESTIWIASGQGAQYSVAVSIYDENGKQTGLATILSNPVAAPWGFVTWLSYLWTQTAYAVSRIRIPWTAPVVFSSMSVSATVQSQKWVEIKEFLFRIQALVRTMANT